MGRLIDADKLQDYFWDNRSKLFQSKDCRIAIDNAPTVEAIPKAEYKVRLKADMVAILEELDLQIDELAAYNLEVAKVQRLIRNKINKLKGNRMGIIFEELGKYDPYTDKFIKNTTTDRIEVSTGGNEFLSKDKLYTKAAMVAMLEDIKKEMNPIKECEYQIYGKEHWNFAGKCQDVIQQKIDALGGNDGL